MPRWRRSSAILAVSLALCCLALLCLALPPGRSRLERPCVLRLEVDGLVRLGPIEVDLPPLLLSDPPDHHALESIHCAPHFRLQPADHHPLTYAQLSCCRGLLSLACGALYP